MPLIFRGDHETYTVFMAKIYSLQCLPSYALHEMFCTLKKEKEATQYTLFSVSMGIQLKKEINQDTPG